MKIYNLPKPSAHQSDLKIHLSDIHLSRLWNRLISVLELIGCREISNIHLYLKYLELQKAYQFFRLAMFKSCDLFDSGLAKTSALITFNGELVYRTPTRYGSRLYGP